MSRVILHTLSASFSANTTFAGVQPLIAAGVLDIDTNKFTYFTPESAHLLTEIIINADLLITYDGKRNAFMILRKYYGLKGASSKLPPHGQHIQIQDEIAKLSKGRVVKFAKAVVANFPDENIDRGKLKSLNQNELENACLEDVKRIQKLYALHLEKKLICPSTKPRAPQVKKSRSLGSKVDLRETPASKNKTSGLLKLEFELIPRTAWFKNVRSMVSKHDWDTLRKECYEKAGYVCEICGERGGRHPVEAHEVWEYDDLNRIQKLVRLIALCPSCHSVKHIGNAYLRGVADEAMVHFQHVNRITDREAKTMLYDAFCLWEERNKHDWVCDVSWLDNKGVPYIPERHQANDLTT
jgi:hypothetical protein